LARHVFLENQRQAMTDQRPLLRAIYDAAVAAAHPDVVLERHLRPVPSGKVICLAAGKGAAAMAAAAERHYLDRLALDPARLSGIATTRHGHGVPTRRIKVVEAGHPMPDEAGLKGAEAALQLAATARDNDLLLVLLSGGGSANWIAPVAGITFVQKLQLTRALLHSGAPIGEVNTVRKHLSRIKGGRLARAGRRAEIGTLAISDVPHDDPSAIASGPTVPDPTTLENARTIVAKYRLEVDDAIRGALNNPNNESCKPGDPAFARATFELIARPRQSLEAAIKVARAAGFETIDLGADLEGEAGRDRLRRRTYRHCAGQRPRRPEPGICAGAGLAAQGHASDLRARRRYRRRRWRWWKRERSGRRHDRFGDLCQDDGAKSRPACLSRQQRRDRVFCRDRRSSADRPDPDQRQRHKGGAGRIVADRRRDCLDHG
jgi:glycerate-2-kinase